MRHGIEGGECEGSGKDEGRAREDGNGVRDVGEKTRGTPTLSAQTSKGNVRGVRGEMCKGVRKGSPQALRRHH